MINLAQRLSLVKPSATLALSSRAEALRAQGKDIINLSVGEPDFNTPEHIKAAAIDAINNNFTRYTAVAGILPLRQAICEKLKHDNQLHYTPEQIVVSTGLKQSLFNLMLAVLEPGDEVIIPSPYWVSYPEMVLLTGAQPVIVNANIECGLKVQAEDIANAITPRTKMILLNSPSNPSGVCYNAQDLIAIAEVLKKHPQILIATDDMYEKIYWGDAPFVNILNVAPELADRTVVGNGVSKTYAMTGWRIGYAAGPAHIIKAMTLIQSQSTSSACSISQKAAVAALTGPQDCLETMRVAFEERYRFLREEFLTMTAVMVPEAHGAFYIYPYMQYYIDRFGLENDVAFCDMLLERAEVAVLPGSTCGTPGFIRLSFAASMEQLVEAMRRIKSVLL